MPRIADYLIEPNNAMLHSPVPDVEMPKFRTSPFYRQLIMDIINYMDAHLNMTFEDYPSPRGVSAVTLAIPFNIIGFKHRGKNKFCINPKIIGRSKDVIESGTNCGCFRFKEDVKVFRHSTVDLEYHDLKGQRTVEKNIGRYEGGFVIQHEVDHSCGICITDREIKKEEEKK